MRRLFSAFVWAFSLTAFALLAGLVLVYWLATAPMRRTAAMPATAPAPAPIPTPEPELGPGRSRASSYPIPLGARRYGAAVIRDAHFYWGFGAPVAMFLGQIHQESRWRADARSPDAAGLTQFTPQTAADMTRMYPADLRALCEGRDCRFDPQWAIRAMIIYDLNLYREFALTTSADDETLAFALAAYNGGARWLTREAMACDDWPECNSSHFVDVVRMCGKTHPARSAASCRENRNYPAAILYRWRPMYQRWLDAEAIR
jgi:soluble lytic murein transglycosylase-like protein